MMQNGFTSFRCNNCHTEIEATLDLIGEVTECPACGEKLTVPAPAASVLRHPADDDDERTVNAMKSRTIRIELEDDL